MSRATEKSNLILSTIVNSVSTGALPITSAMERFDRQEAVGRSGPVPAAGVSFCEHL